MNENHFTFSLIIQQNQRWIADDVSDDVGCDWL